MSHNTFGHLFRVTTFGESHGVALGCVVDGCPPGLALSAEDIQAELDGRKPGQSRFTTQRREPDQVRRRAAQHTLGAWGDVAESILGIGGPEPVEGDSREFFEVVQGHEITADEPDFYA